MPDIVLFASGELGAQVFNCIKSPIIRKVFTDKASVKVQQHAHERGISVFVGNPGKFRPFDDDVELKDIWFVSVNYLFLLPSTMIDAVNGRALNIHGSLLPHYRGRTPHVWALINGEDSCGITVHMLTAEMDAGDILLQKVIPVGPYETGGSLLDRFRRMYPVMLFDVFRRIDSNTLVPVPQDHSQATTYPKRTPADGEIDWGWSCVRIRNWVRAQTKPYPGAYTYRDGKKIRVWWCEPVTGSFNDTSLPGTVCGACFGGPVIRCADGYVALIDYDEEP